ncbi:MAG TPA: hypothetical protein VFG21_01345 [Xanthomonadaceae bacterium]|nr:hypothetical protein [Xanthomonadaceae bacterium]
MAKSSVVPRLASLGTLRDRFALNALRAEVARLRATLDRRDRQIANLERQIADGFSLGYRLGREDSKPGSGD